MKKRGIKSDREGGRVSGCFGDIQAGQALAGGLRQGKAISLKKAQKISLPLINSSVAQPLWTNSRHLGKHLSAAEPQLPSESRPGRGRLAACQDWLVTLGWACDPPPHFHA